MQFNKHASMNVSESHTLLKWVKLKKYCELSGDTPDAVHGKRKRGIWLDGAQCKIGPDGKLWINLIEVEKWVEHNHIPFPTLRLA